MSILNFIKKYLALGLIGVAIFSFFYWQLYEYLRLENLRLYQEIAQDWTRNHYTAAVCLYIVSYVVMIACTIPVATSWTLVGGFLFGGIAFVYAMFSTTVGGLILYLSIRSAIGSHLAAKSSGWIKRLEKGFKRNAFNYILMLRLVPIMPCWVSNITAGVLNVPMRTFLAATVLGIMPSTLIYVLAGRGLDTLLADTHTPIGMILLRPSIFLPLLGLAILSIFPVIYKSVKKL